jgi:hypothetical protein
MTEIDRARCRKAAAECIALARTTSDPDTKQILLTRAQEWLKLAYSEHDSEFVRLLAEFNKRQMSSGEKAGRPAPARRTRRLPMQQQEVRQQEVQQQEVQQQEVQQQQAKAKPDDER